MRTIPLLTLESQIKRGLRQHLRTLGFKRDAQGGLEPPIGSKSTIRALHSDQRHRKLVSEHKFITAEWPALSHYFANGPDVTPGRIKPRLEIIEADSWQSRLFRLASLTWSVPVSHGYGRRMRFLVWDDSNDKLIGLLALGDPVFNLSVRDRYVGWSTDQRQARLVNVMDAFVLGALPPYNALLAGKLIASLVRSREIKDAFAARYSNTIGLISHERKKPTLALVTTSSALGKSSLYNRLKLNGTLIFKPIGFTQGWGHFHVPDSIFDLIRQYLRRKRHKYASNFRFGDGPNWRLRALREGFSLIGMRPELLCHGIRREVFACELATNAKAILCGDQTRPRYTDLLAVEEIAALARARWLEPRATRFPEYRLHSRDRVLDLLHGNGSASAKVRRKDIHGSRAS